MKGGSGTLNQRRPQLLTMTKKQEAFIKKLTKEKKLSKEQLSALEREDVKYAYIVRMANYLIEQNVCNVDKSESAAEVTRCMDMITSRVSAGCLDKNIDQIMGFLLPLRKDILIGSNMKRFFCHVYEYLMNAEKAPDGVFNFNRVRKDPEISAYQIRVQAGLKNLIELLYSGMSWDQVKKVLRYCRETKEPGRIVDMTTKTQCLLDDYINNGNESLVAHMMREKMLHRLNMYDPEKRQLSDWYDYETHKFEFSIDQFDDFFIWEQDPWCDSPDLHFNSDYASQQKFSSNSIANEIVDFVTSNDFEASYGKNEVFNIWKKEWVEDENVIHNLKKCAEAMNTTLVAEVPSHRVSIGISKRLFISIDYEKMYGVRCHSCGSVWFDCKTTRKTSLLIAPDGRIFKNHYDCAGKKTRTSPLLISELLHILDPNFTRDVDLFDDAVGHKTDDMFVALVHRIVRSCAKRNRFIHDVLDDCKHFGCLLPISFNDVIAYYNRKHFITSKYKLANQLNINWNKRNLNLSYLLIKAYPKVEDGISKRILLQINDESVIPSYEEAHRVDEKVDRFIAKVLEKRLEMMYRNKSKSKASEAEKQYRAEVESEVGTAILEDELDMFIREKVNSECGFNAYRISRQANDYVRMCRSTKQKIRIDISQEAQLDNLHDRVAHGKDENYYRTHTNQVKIPKDSKFNKLRKLLPEDFEWIKNRKRLILETELQHHCVWSYASKISEDRCAIYSFVDSRAEHTSDGKAKRYTIEFMVDRDGKYYIQQVQGKYDRVNTGVMHDYIQTFLDNQDKEENNTAAA